MRANLRAYGGCVTGKADAMTPAGIRHDSRIHEKPKHLKWTKKAVKGLTYITTDRGPMKRWLTVIGREQSDLCSCGEIQNAVHLRRCRLVGDGKGRSMEECQRDVEWLEAVVDLLT